MRVAIVRWSVTIHFGDIVTTKKRPSKASFLLFKDWAMQADAIRGKTEEKPGNGVSSITLIL